MPLPRPETKRQGHLFRLLRVKAGKSQKAIAEKIGLDPTKLSKIEAGVIDPPFSLGCKIIAAIEMEPAEALELLRMYQEDTE